MNDGFPPLVLPRPESRQRRKEGRPFPLRPEILGRRAEIARVLKVTIEGLSKHLKSLSDEERRAVFYKLEHEVHLDPDSLSGTDLKPIAQPAPEVVYAVPRQNSLDKLLEKVDDFATAPVKKGCVPNQWVAQLKSIEEADPKERISYDLRRRYSTLVKSKSLICEIEFLSLKPGPRKQREEIEGWIKDLQMAFGNGRHGTFFEHELIPPTCRAVIRCTGTMFKALVEEPQWIERIRWIESRPRFQTFTEVVESFRVQDLAPLGTPPNDAPVVCIIDSGVTIGNPFLQMVVSPTLSKSFLRKQPSNPNDEHGHGSAVASLASYYTLNLAAGATNTPRLRVASARILDAQNQIEDERLFSKVLEEVVLHFTKEGIKIFCLAIGDDRKIWGDSNKQVLPRNSWVARRIDQLSRKHDVVFVTCTGNIDLSELRALAKEGKPYPEYFADETSRLLDPGQAALAVTVGSIAPGTKIVSAKDCRAIALQNQPSPFTRCGPGIKRETKPDVVEYGGNLAYDNSLGTVIENRGLQVVAASRQLSPAVSFWTGTSFSAPRAAHRLALIDHDLRSLGITPSACLLRAFLVNSATHRDEHGELGAIRETFKGKAHRDQLVNLLGHGIPDQDRATGCDDYSVVTFFQGEIEPDRVMFFDIPVPANLAKARDQRRLTVTVAYAPEVQRWGLERYFGGDLKWRMFRGDKSRDEIVVAMSEPVDESDQETEFDLGMVDKAEATLPKELSFDPSFQRRSRGTVQHATYMWSQHKASYSDGHYTLAIAAFKRWKRRVSDMPLAVVVRLEDLGRNVPIYSEIRAAVEVEISPATFI